MTVHTESRVVSAPAQLLFDLVADVERAERPDLELPLGGHDFRVGEPQRSRFDPEYKVCKVWRGGERETYGAP